LYAVRKYMQSGRDGRGSGHANELTLLIKWHNTSSESVFIDWFYPKNCPVKKIDGKLIFDNRPNNTIVIEKIKKTMRSIK
jgi:hypothetical protein